MISDMALLTTIMTQCVRAFSDRRSPGQTQLTAGVIDLTVNDVTDDTKLIMSQLHRPERHQSEEPVTQPIVHSTTYRFNTVDHYSTVSNEVSHGL